VLRRYQPDRTLTATARKAVARMLDECGGLDRATVYLDWVHTSADTWARQLRGEVAWPGGDLVRRMDPVSLGRSLEQRLDVALAWDRAGRRTAPKVNGRHAAPSFGDTLRELAELQAEGGFDVH
jgi:hypothetical protein